MKDKFEEAIKSKLSVTLIGHQIDGKEEAAIACNTLHQQALKEVRAKDRKTVKGLMVKICELEGELLVKTFGMKEKSCQKKMIG